MRRMRVLRTAPLLPARQVLSGKLNQLPPAVLGGGWGDPTPKPAAVDDCAVVHGQHTGGW